MAEPVDFAKLLKQREGEEAFTRMDENADCIQIIIEAIKAMRKIGLSSAEIADLLRHAARELD